VRTLKVYAFASRIVRDEHHDLGIVHEGMDDPATLFAGYRSVDLDDRLVAPKAIAYPTPNEPAASSTRRPRGAYPPEIESGPD
jgi:hypothetical protein